MKLTRLFTAALLITGFCGAPIAGRYGTFDKPFGSRRIHVRISAYPGRAA